MPRPRRADARWRRSAGSRRRCPAPRCTTRSRPTPTRCCCAALAAAGCRFDVASPAEVTAALDAGAAPGRPRLLQPGQAARRHRRFAGRLGRRPVRRRLAGGEPPRSPRPRPGSSVLCRIVTSGEGSDWPLSRKYGCSTDEAVADPALGRRARARRRRRLLPRRLAAARPVRPGTRRSRPPPRVFAALRGRRSAPLAARPRRRVPGARSRAAARRSTSYGAAIERSLRERFGADRPAHDLSSPVGRSSPTPGALVTTVVARRAPRRHPLGLPRRRRVHRAGRDPRRGDPLPARTRRRRTRPGRACSPGRPATAPTCSTRSVPVDLPLSLAEGDTVRLLSTGRLHEPATRRSASTASRRCRPGWP